MNIKDVLRWTAYISLFAVLFIPLIVTGSTFFPYIVGKNVFFRVFTEIAFGSWAILAILDKRYRLSFSWITALAGVFVLILAIADLQGVAPWRSFWSNFERMEGLLTHVHILMYLITASVLLSTEKIWNWFFQVSLGVSIIVGINGLMQHATSSRIDATLGNADYLAVYMLFNIFLALILLLRSKVQKGMRWVYGGVILFDALVMYYTATRGVILGLIGGVMVTAILIALFEKSQPILRKIAIGILTAVVVVVVGFLAVKNTDAVKNNPVLGRFASISVQDGTTKSRLIIWNMAFQGFKEKPLLGWGQENFNYVFAKYYDARMYGQEPWFDRTHNVFLDWLIAGGILGLALYLSLFISALYYIWRKEHHRFFFLAWLHRHEQNPFSLVERSVLTGLLAGYFFQNLFVFDNVVSYAFFFSILAYIVSSYRRVSGVDHAIGLNSKLPYANYASGAVILVIICGIYYTALKPYIAAASLVSAMQPQQTLGLKGNMDYFDKALNQYSVGRSEIREQYLQIATQVNQAQGISDMDKKTFTDKAVSAMQDQFKETPTDVRELIFFGSFLSSSGHPQEALDYFTKALALSPHKQDILFGRGSAFVMLNQYDKAFDDAKMAYEIEKDNPTGKSFYSAVSIYVKHGEVVKEVYGTDTPGEERIARAYADNGQFTKAVASAEALIKATSNGADGHLLLASIYLKQNNTSMAIAELKIAAQLNPSYQEQVDAVIEQLQAKK